MTTIQIICVSILGTGFFLFFSFMLGQLHFYIGDGEMSSDYTVLKAFAYGIPTFTAGILAFAILGLLIAGACGAF